MAQKTPTGKEEEEKNKDEGNKVPEKKEEKQKEIKKKPKEEKPDGSIDEDIKKEIKAVTEANTVLKKELKVMTKKFNDLKNEVQISKNMSIIKSEAQVGFMGIASKLVKSGMSASNIKKEFPSLFKMKIGE